MEQRIVCAANRSSYGEIILGARHWDKHMHTQAPKMKSLSIPYDIHFHQQGFIDNKGNFLSREEAWIVAERAGQIIRRVGGDMVNGVGRLYSENLY